MSVSENYVPQAENLEHLESVIQKLQDVSLQSSLKKNQVVSMVDSLIRKLNGDKGTDYSMVITKLEDFLSNYPEFTNEETSHESNEAKTQLQTLSDQNKRLKEVLASRTAYNEEAAKINSEYEEGIDKLMKLTREKKSQEDDMMFGTVRELSAQLKDLKDDEWSVFEELMRNENAIYTLTRSITDLYRILADSSSDISQSEVLKYMAKFYESRIAGKSDSYSYMTHEVTDILFTERGV